MKGLRAQCRGVTDCLLSLVLLTACGQDQEQSRANSLIIARTADMVSLDPAITTGSGDGTIIDLCYEQLTRIDPHSPDGSAIGELAVSWQAAPDGLSWTFKLRTDSAFDDGSPVRAEAVVASFNRVLKVNRAPAQGFVWMRSVEAVDPHTVRFDLNGPFPALAHILTLPSTSVINPQAIKSYERGGDLAQGWLAEHCAGSGPYTVERWDRGQRLTLLRTESSAKAAFERVVFKIIPDEAARRLQLSKGDVDIVENIGAAVAAQYAALDGVRLSVSPSANIVSYLTLNTRRGVLQDVRVRRAIALAVDYRAIIEDVLNGNAIALSSLIPPGVIGHNPDLPAPSRNVEEARSQLAAAGHPGGIDLVMVVGEPGPVSQMVQSNLADAGIRVRFKRLAPSAFDNARATGDFDLLYEGWILDFPDPVIFLNLAFSSAAAGGAGNFSGYSNPDVDHLLSEAAMTAKPQQRIALYREAEAIILSEQPIVMLFSPKVILASRDTLTGVKLNRYQPNYLDIVSMSRVPR